MSKYSRMGAGNLSQDALEQQSFAKNEKQFGVVYDLLAAGEINGLVGGLSGVFFNDTPLIDHAKYEKLRLRTATGVTINGNANTVTAAGLFNGVSLNDGDRYVQMVGTGGGASPGCITTSLSGAVATGKDKVTLASSVLIAGTHDKNYTGVSSPFLSDHVGYKIRITGAGLDGTQYKGIITNVISGTEATVFPALPTGVSSGATVFIDNFYKVASIQSTSTATLTGYTPSTNSTNSTVVLSAATTYYNDRSQAVNYDNAYIDFRNGTRYQVPVEANLSAYQAPSASYMIAPGTNLTWFAGTGGKTLSPSNATASATFITPSQFNFAQNVKNEIDRVNITIDFPSGLRYISPKGNDGPGAVEFQIILHYKTDSSESSFKTELIYGRDYGGADFIDGVHQAASTSTTKSNSYSWITASSSYDHQDKIDDYFSGYGANISRRGSGTVVRRGQSASFVQEYPIFLADRQPLHDWKIEIRRLTPDNATHWNPVEIDQMGAQLFASCNVKTVEAQITDKFTYPTSAYAVVSYAAEDFSSPPKRAYRIQGRKVKVPTNYITREEAGSVQAKYTRNISNGTDTGTYQSWNGSFRGDQSLTATSPNYKKVYTSNPAWIFYDILTDKEIGLGDYIEESDVDKYALYQIARYCDEVIPNGKGGTEPRFACNVYLTSQSEAYKVLKDLASSFRAMLYWLDSEIVAIQDSPKEPIYSFTTGNVQDGIFTYSYTGQKARTNQINVTWNNPLEMYKKTVLTVEDTQNIESVGKIIPNDIVAFGCTSEGQARRLADWHLSTAKNEGEIVSFATGLNGAFLRPGDIINVQDKRRHGFEASGRVSASSSTTSINLDRTVTAPGGGNLNGCNLYLIYTEPGIYLKQESATINSVAYSRGEILVEDASGNSLVSQSQAANLVDDSGNAVLTQFSENSRVEVKAITTNASSGSTVAVSGAFSSAPQQDTVWAIGRKDDVNTDDLKEYRILSIAQVEPNIFEIAASLYAKDKFDEIDADLPVVTNTYIPTPKMSDPVPAPTGLGIEQLPSSTTSNEGTGTTVSVVASWTPPVEGFTDSNGTTTNISYRFLSGFEIQHTFPTGNESSSWTTVRDINGNANTFTFSNVDAGRYTIRVRAVNTLGNYSAWNEVTREIFSLPPGTSRIARVSRGGFLTFSPEIDASTGLISIDATAYRYIHPSGEEYIFNPASTAQLQQAFSSLPAGQSAFWVFDASNTSDPWLAMQLHTDSVAADASGNASNFNYLKTIGASNNGLTAASGTVTVAAGGTDVTGSSTAFTTDYYVGGFIKVSTNSAAGTQVANSEYREVVEIESNTKLFVRNPFTRTFSGQSPMKQTTGIRFQEDAILAEVTRASSGASPYTAEFYVQGKGATGSDTIKTIHIFRTGTLPTEVPDPTAAEIGRDPVDGDYATIHYTDRDVVLVYDGTGWGEEAEIIDGNLIREGTLPGDSIEEEASFDKLHRLKNVYDAVSQLNITDRGQIAFRNAADNASPTSWAQVAKIKISSIDTENKDKTAKLAKLSARSHVHVVEDVSDAAQDSGTVPSKAVFRSSSSASEGTITSSSTITSAGYKSARVYVSNVNSSVKVGDTFSVTGISFFFSTPKVTNVQMSSSPYYVTLSTSVPKFTGTRVATFTRKFHTINLGSPITSTGSPDYSANYIVKFQIQAPSEVTTGETIVVGTVTGDALAAATITGAKIAGTTITGANLANSTITGAKINSSTITAANIVDGTITGTKIDSATITDSNIVNGTITGTKIDSATITGSNMVNGTITSAQIGNATITGSKIDAATITGSNIASATIAGSNIGSSTISNSLLVDNTIQGGKIALATIQGGNIATNTITANNITVTTLSSLSANIGAISSGSLQGGTVPDANGAPSGSETGSFFDLTLGRFVVGNASNYVLWNGTSLVIGGNVIASGNIQSNAVTQAKIAASAVGANEIAALAVQRAKIANDAIDATKVAANAITATEIAANTITANQLTTGSFVTSSANITDGVITNAKIASLEAGKISANSTFSNNLTVGSTFTMNSSGKIYSSGKTDYGNATAGFFLGYSGGQYKFHLGNNTNYVKWDGSTLSINGNLNISSSEVSGLSDAATTAISSIRSGVTKANVGLGNVDNDSTATIRGGVTKANVGLGNVDNDSTSTIRGGISIASNGTLSGGGGGQVTASGLGANTDSTATIRAGVTKANVGLSVVENKTSATIRGEITSANVTGGLGFTPYNSTNPSGFTTFDAAGVQNAITNNVTSISGAKINTGIMNAAQVSVINLDASNISTGTLSADRIAANSIEIAKINNIELATGSTGNIGFGEDALTNASNSDVRNNIAIGYEAAKNMNATYSGNRSEQNVFIGHQVALKATTGVRFNVGIGHQACGSLTPTNQSFTGDQNVAIGLYAGTVLRYGSTNTLIGSNAGVELYSGSGNAFIGSQAGRYATTGGSNVCVGFNSGYYITTGSYNTMVGRHAGYGWYGNYITSITGSSNTCIGHEARVNSASAIRGIAIGYRASAGSNQARIGNSQVSSIGGYAVWSDLSDERDKMLITDLTLGLNLVNTITPKKFKLNPRDSYYWENEEEETSGFDQEGFDAGTQAREDFSFGFLAQEVEEKVSALDSDPTGVVDDSSPDRLHLRSSELIAVLWKAVQELSTKNDALEARIATLEGG